MKKPEGPGARHREILRPHPTSGPQTRPHRLPASSLVEADPERLDTFLSAPPEADAATPFELRNPTWHTEEIYRILPSSQHRILYL